MGFMKFSLVKSFTSLVNFLDIKVTISRSRHITSVYFNPGLLMLTVTSYTHLLALTRGFTSAPRS